MEVALSHLTILLHSNLGLGVLNASRKYRFAIVRRPEGPNAIFYRASAVSLVNFRKACGIGKYYESLMINHTCVRGI